VLFYVNSDRMNLLFGSQLYDYQYNMGLLLLERKAWEEQREQLTASIQEAEENIQRQKAAHLVALGEAERRQDLLKKALDIEKHCVADVSETVHMYFPQFIIEEFKSGPTLTGNL
jgi:urease accessory protein UreH